MATNKIFPGINEPTIDPASLRSTALQTKESIEILTGQRGQRRYSAVTWDDLVRYGFITESQIPR